jgi:hypothetical protein
MGMPTEVRIFDELRAGATLVEQSLKQEDFGTASAGVNLTSPIGGVWNA